MKKRAARKNYFKRPRKRHIRSKLSRSVVRYIPMEGTERLLAYIFYEGEHWFLLDQIIRVLGSFLARSDSEHKQFCCLWSCKMRLLTRNAFRKIGGSHGIMTTSCSDPYIVRQVDEIMTKQNIPNEHIHHNESNKGASCLNGFTCISQLPMLLRGEKTQEQIRQYDTKTGRLIRVLLIDFQSIYELCRMARPEFHPVLSLFLAFSQLCTGRGEARSALTKRDKEIIAAKQRWRCGVCDQLFDASARYEIDHGIALSLGGRNNESNLWAICITCHKKITEDEMSYPLKPL